MLLFCSRFFTLLKFWISSAESLRTNMKYNNILILSNVWCHNTLCFFRTKLQTILAYGVSCQKWKYIPPCKLKAVSLTNICNSNNNLRHLSVEMKRLYHTTIHMWHLPYQNSVIVSWISLSWGCQWQPWLQNCWYFL